MNLLEIAEEGELCSTLCWLPLNQRNPQLQQPQPPPPQQPLPLLLTQLQLQQLRLLLPLRSEEDLLSANRCVLCTFHILNFAKYRHYLLLIIYSGVFKIHRYITYRCTLYDNRKLFIAAEEYVNKFLHITQVELRTSNIRCLHRSSILPASLEKRRITSSMMMTT